MAKKKKAAATGGQITAIKETAADKRFTIINYIVLGLIFVIVAYPLLYVISASFSSSTAIIQGRVYLWPVDFSLDGYNAVFKYSSVWTGYLNSFFYMGIGTLINVFMTVILAYPLSRKGLPGQGFVVGLLVFTMMFNAGLIPNYMLIKSLGMLDTRAVLIIPMALNVWNTMITITFFKNNIPVELLEAAKIDGCNDFIFIWKIVLPLSKAILAVITLYYAVEHWNSYFNAMLYLKSAELKPLQLVLRDILVQNQLSLDALATMDPDQMAAKENLAILMKYSLIIVSSVPLLVFYPFVQKYFVKGVMVGSVKG